MVINSQFPEFFLFVKHSQNAVTHKKIANGVRTVKMLWTAPKSLTEKVVIYATVARNGGTFWVNQKSDVISVN
jgi:hypothetical protein